MGLARDRYLEVCEALASKYRRERCDYRIKKNASFFQCIDYVFRYVNVNGDHVRFDRLAPMLRGSLAELKSRHQTGLLDAPVVHIDIGCGPGSFSWVFHDHLEEHMWRPGGCPSVHFFGFDWCPAMVDLAQMIWHDLGLRHEARFFRTQRSLEHAVSQLPTGCHLVITFGYVLIQAGEEPSRRIVESLARLCDRLATINLDDRCADIVLVDSYFSRERIDDFEGAVEKFRSELTDRWNRIPLDSSVPPTGSLAHFRNWD